MHWTYWLLLTNQSLSDWVKQEELGRGSGMARQVLSQYRKYSLKH